MNPSPRSLAVVALLLVLTAVLLWFLSGLGGTADTEAPDDPASHAAREASAPGSTPETGIETEAFRDAPPGQEEPSAPTKLTVRFEWAEGTPAAGIRARTHAPDANHARPLGYRGVRAGADGTLTIDPAAPGRHIFWVDRGGGGSVSVEEGQHARLTIRIPRGLRVTGAVQDLRGRPVPGADVWLSAYGNGRNGQVVVRCDAGGRFEIRAVGSMHWVAARAAGYAPSLAHLIQGEPGESRELRLTLRGRGGSLEGTVFRWDGKPGKGALLRIELPDDYNQRTSGTYPAPPLVQVADAEGSFRFTGLPVGRLPVEVVARGAAPFLEEVVIAPGQTTDLQISLDPMAVVQGKVTDRDGAPVVRARVSWGGFGDFRSAACYTAADGSFRLAQLPAGSVTLRASHRGYGHTSTTMELAGGSPARWDPRLDAGLVLQAQVVDAAGEPLAKHFVSARVEGDDPARGGPRAWVGQDRSDDEGRIRIARCPEKPLVIHVYADTRDGRTLVGRLRGVVVRREPMVLRLAGDARVTGALSGTILDHAGHPLAVRVVAEFSGADRSTFEAFSDAATGAFRIGPLLPDRYDLRVEYLDGRFSLGSQVVKADRTRKLGPLRLPEPGILRLHRASAPEDVAGAMIALAQHLEAANRVMPIRNIGAGKLPTEIRLLPGRYLLSIKGPRLVPRSETVHLAPGGTTDWDLRATPGIRITVTVSGSTTESWMSLSAHRLRDGFTRSGGAVRQGNDHVGTLVLPPGRYRITAASGTRRASTEVEVPAGAAQPVRVKLNL